MIVGIFIGIGIGVGGIYLLGVVLFLLGALAADRVCRALGGKRSGFDKRAWLKAFGYSFTWPLQQLSGNK